MAKINGLKLIILIFFTAASLAPADVIYVDANSPNDPGTGTASDPFRRIQDGIDDDDTGSGDIIQLQPGVYTGPGNYNIDPNGFSITIRSSDPNNPEIVASTIIDPNRAGRGFNLYNGESRDCMIAGLTIRNGYTVTDTAGGAIRCSSGSGPTIRNCVIENCSAIGSGGGLFCVGGSPYIIGCQIQGNSASYGGGISLEFCDTPNRPVILGCRITGNDASLEGGGLDLAKSRAMVSNSIITGNNATSNGGAINCFFLSELSIFNCTVVKNIAADSGGALYCQYGSNTHVRNSILWANEANQGSQVSLPFLYNSDSRASIYYSDVQEGQSGMFVDPNNTLNWDENNIATDPNFAFFGPGVESALWDFHLSSKAGRWDSSIGGWVNDEFTSSCIDAGDPNSDYTSEPWPHGGRINMGAYGGTHQASMNGNRADFNIDGAVNLVDFAEFADRWLNEEACIEDMTGDSKVDSTDLSILAYNWLWQTQ